MAPVKSMDEDNFPRIDYKNILPDDAYVKCKWASAFGSEVFSARQLGLRETATLTLRYLPGVTAACIVLKGDDPVPYEIHDAPDVNDGHRWLEIKVGRQVAAK